MIRYGPDGAAYKFPDDATEQEISRYFAELKPATAPQQVEKQRGRAITQGITFGFGEEIEAAGRAALGAIGLTEDDRGYTAIRDELREKLEAYRQAYPGEAITMELAGAIIPSLATLGAGAALSAGTTGARVAPTVARTTAIGAGEGGLAAAGFSEREGLERLADVPGGAVTGAAFSAVAAPAGIYLSALLLVCLASDQLHGYKQSYSDWLTLLVRLSMRS